MMYVDEATWKRKPISDGFGRLEYPFYSVTFPVDVTALYERAKRLGVSFYHACIYAAMTAVNGIDPFLYKLRPDGVVRHDFLSPSFTVPDGDDLFKIVTMDWLPGETMTGFSLRAGALAEAQKDTFPDEDSEKRDDLVYISCLPWLDFTSLTNERSINRMDSIPRLAWGKMTAGEGKRRMPFCVDVNHRLIDGRHIGLLAEALARTMGTDPGEGNGKEAEA